MALRSIKDKQGTDLKESFEAIKEIPRFFTEIRQGSPKYFFFNAVCRLLTALTPVVALYVGKLIIDEIIFQSQAETADFSQLWIYVGIELGIAILSDVLNRMVNLTDGLLGDLYSNNSSVKIIKKTNELLSLIHI